MKTVKVIVGIVVIVGLLWFLYHVWEQRQFKATLDAANAAYAGASSAQDLEKAKAGYEALLAKASGSSQKRAAEAGIAQCDANIAYFAALNKGTIDNYSNALELLRKAKDLTGDLTGEFGNRIAELEPRLKGASGPSLDEMKAELARLKAQPFAEAARGLTALYRWRAIWREQGKYLDDKDREAVFAEAQGILQILRDSYSAIFEKNLAASKLPSASLEDKVKILADLHNLQYVDPLIAAAYSEKYNPELIEAQNAAEELKAKRLAR